LGKSCEYALDWLEYLGGSTEISELADLMHYNIKRMRDFRRRIIGRLEERGIVTVSGETVQLVEDWLEKLNIERDRSGEIEKYRLDMLKFNEQSRAYRERHNNPADKHDGFGLGAYDVDNPPEPLPLSELAQAMKAYLDLSPADKQHGGSWVATALWSKGLIGWRPTLEEAEYALYELSPERELRCRLAVARYESRLAAEKRKAG
jgi:hypothetical protein